MLLNDDREGTGWVPDLTQIDSGWKDKQWGTEPVYILAAQAGFRGIHVSEGTPMPLTPPASPSARAPHLCLPRRPPPGIGRSRRYSS